MKPGNTIATILGFWNRAVSSRLSLLIVSAIMFVSAISARGVEIEVESRRTGGFGFPNEGWQPMIAGWTFTAAGEQIQITATQTIKVRDISLGSPDDVVTGPDGIPFTIEDGGLAGPAAFTPLEEASVDNRSLTVPRPFGTIIPSGGALMAAFRPDSVTSSPQFRAWDADLRTATVREFAIPADALFFVGSGPATFTAPSAGVLYLGINDTFVLNNSGAFRATVVLVPEPGSLMLVIALGGMATTRRLRKRGSSR